jgi:signal transduction histidine kinase
MQPNEILLHIKPIWVKRVSMTMARGSILKEDLVQQLLQFFEKLQTAVETGNAEWFFPLLQTWSQTLTETDLEGEQNSLTHIIKGLILITESVCLETLKAEDSLTILNSILPIFAEISEKAANYEINAKVAYFKKELANINSSIVKMNRSKSGFITVAAHELKTPLTIIEGYSAMLAENFKKNANFNTFPPLIEGMQRGTLRLKNLIDDMIDVSLIDNNLLELNYQPYWVNRIMDTVALEVQTTLLERKLQFEITEFDGYRELNYGDPERVLQVFRNIVSNAIKYTPDGGKIEINGRKLPGFIEISISDTGIGIDSEDQRIIFEKFSQVGDVSLHSSGKSKFKGGGPGLGLHIAKGIIEKHGGTIWADSSGYNEQNCPGTIVHILLPILDETKISKRESSNIK